MAKGYDILGNIAIIDVEKGERATAKKIMAEHSMVTTVIAKAGAVSGKYRIRKFRYVAGEKTYVATYKENNCIFKFDVRKSFFSNRLSFERARILDLVKEKETVLVMFAGVGPFAIEIAKSHPKAKVVAIELNKEAYKSMVDNMTANKIKNMTAVLGDVSTASNRYKNSSNRIIMPLPMKSMEFLDQVLLVAKKDAIVHIYTFGSKESAFAEARQKISEHAKQKGYKVSFLFERVARDYSFNQIEVAVDYKIRK